jgi:hypothetical protein
MQGSAPLANAHWPEGVDAPPVRRDVETGRVLRNALTSSRYLQDVSLYLLDVISL